jgi:hypothetical protein
MRVSIPVVRGAGGHRLQTGAAKSFHANQVTRSAGIPCVVMGVNNPFSLRGGTRADATAGRDVVRNWELASRPAALTPDSVSSYPDYMESGKRPTIMRSRPRID